MGFFEVDALLICSFLAFFFYGAKINVINSVLASQSDYLIQIIRGSADVTFKSLELFVITPLMQINMCLIGHLQAPPPPVITPTNTAAC